MDKEYELEVIRKGIRPKQFFSYCSRRFKEKTGHNISEWIKDFDHFSSPDEEVNTSCLHEYWDKSSVLQLQYESKLILPFHICLFLDKEYHFIMMFSRTDDKTGNGYMYVVKYRKE